MSVWCECGHGSKWHQYPETKPLWECNFERCQCKKFEDKYPSSDSCETCGCLYRDWLGNYHGADNKQNSTHDRFCCCRKFKWNEPAVKLKIMLNPLAINYLPAQVFIRLIRKSKPPGVVAYWALGMWKSQHSWNIADNGTYTADIVAEDGTVLWLWDMEKMISAGSRLTINLDPMIGSTPVDQLVEQAHRQRTSLKLSDPENKEEPGKRIVEI